MDAETRQALARHVFDNRKRMRGLAVLGCGLVKGRVRAWVSNTGRFFWNTSSFLGRKNASIATVKGGPADQVVLGKEIEGYRGKAVSLWSEAKRFTANVVISRNRMNRAPLFEGRCPCAMWDLTFDPHQHIASQVSSACTWAFWTGVWGAIICVPIPPLYPYRGIGDYRGKAVYLWSEAKRFTANVVKVHCKCSLGSLQM